MKANARHFAKASLGATLFVMAGMAAVHAAEAPMKPSGIAEAMMPNDDRSFIEGAASANKFEIEAGKLASTKATDPQLKAFGEKMVTDHTEAAQKLQALATAKNVTVPTTLAPRHQKALDALNKDKAGKDFDEDFRNKMVASHKEAVSLFDQTTKKTKDPDIKAFATEMLPKLQAHGAAANELNKGH
jgi:putative membrane protein